MDRNSVDEREAIAGEIALGLLSDRERADALARDPTLAEAVSRWENQLAGIALDAAPVAPAATTLASIHQKLDALQPAPLPVPESNTTGFVTYLLNNIAFWRILGGASFATAAALGAALVMGPIAPPPPIVENQIEPTPAVVSAPAPLLMSPILPREGAALYVATYDAAHSRLIVQPAAAEAGRGVPYLWLSPGEGGDPIALGGLDHERPIVLALSPVAVRAMTLSAGLVLTLEPVEPAGAAVGPVLATGKFRGF